MKILLIYPSNTKYVPHAYHYLKILNNYNVEYDIVIWDQDDIVENDCIVFKNKNVNKRIFSRIISYYRYASFVKKTIKKNKYDKIIIFSIFLSVLLYPFLRKNYKNKYIFDIRDYNPVVKVVPSVINMLVKDSYITAISSPGFKKWLPESKKYTLSHNFNFESWQESLVDKKLNNHKYIILTIGFLRHYDVNKSLIDTFANDDDIILKFVGTGEVHKLLKDYVFENQIKNVVFFGEYQKKDELSFLEDVSLVNIILENDINSRTLMTNRIYTSLCSGVPVLVNEGSTQGEYVKKYNLGMFFENFAQLKENVKSFLLNFDGQLFEKGSNDFLVEIKEDQNIFEKNIVNFLRQNKDEKIS